MKKSEYKLFFYIDENPVNMNSKNINNNSSQQNIDIKNKLFFQDNQKNIYNKAKQKYDFYLKRNKNILLLNKKSISGKITSKDYLEGIENLDKEIKKDGLTLLPCVPSKKVNNKNVEELKKLQRSTVTMRRIEYSMKVKKASNQKRYKNNIKKIIIIQKWARGFLLRNFLSNLSYFEVFKNEFLDHLKKFVFLKHRQDMNNVIIYYQKKIIIEEEKKNNYIKNKIMNHNPDDKNDSDNFNVNNININNNNYNKDDNNAYMISKNENEAMSFGDNLNIANHNKKSLDVIKENSNERYIDEDSIMEYNNRNKNKLNNDINNNILLLSSKDFSEKNLINSSNNFMNNDSNLLFNSNTYINNNIGMNNNNNNNNTPFVLNESSIVYDEGNKKLEESIKNNNNMNKNENKKETLNSNKDDIFSTLKNEEVRDVFNAKHTDNLIKPSSSLINNIINNQNDMNENNNKELIIKRPKLNRKFIEEISSAHGGTPEKKENYETKFEENKNNDEKNISNKIDEEMNNENDDENIVIKDNDEKISEENGNKVKINNYFKTNNEKDEKDSPISENEKNGKYIRKINYINSMKSNQFGSISNPTNSTLDSNTLNINRKLVLDDNISIVNNNKTVLEEQNSNNNSNDIKFIKPINKPMIITKIRLRNDKNVEYIIIKCSKSEKKLLPKIFDINYQYSQENNDEIINSNNNKYIGIKESDGEKNKIASNEDNNNINIENGHNNNKILNEINDSLSNININLDSNIINTGNSKNDSNDLNINVLNVVNNNIDELNSSIKNIVKEGIPIDNKPDFQKNNPFTKSIRALLELDKPANNVNDNKGNNNDNNEIKEEINDEIDENLIIENNNMSNNMNNNIENNIINKENVLNQMSIEEIKEVNEEFEEEKDYDLELTQKKIYNSNNSNENIESSKDIGSILDSNKNLIKNSMKKSQKNDDDNLIICSQNICYNILPTKKKNSFDKSLILLAFLFMKQIKFNVKPYIFNMLKHFWIEKLKK